MKVTFFGHRRLENREEVRIWLEPTVARLAACGARTFYLGGYGEFDRLAQRAVRAAQRAHPEVEAVLVLAYPEAGGWRGRRAIRRDGLSAAGARAAALRHRPAQPVDGG